MHHITLQGVSYVSWQQWSECSERRGCGVNVSGWSDQDRAGHFAGRDSAKVSYSLQTEAQAASTTRIVTAILLISWFHIAIMSIVKSLILILTWLYSTLLYSLLRFTWLLESHLLGDVYTVLYWTNINLNSFYSSHLSYKNKRRSSWEGEVSVYIRWH